MKKLFILLAIALFLPVGSFAAATDNGTAGSRLVLDTSSPQLVIASSPGVFQYYGDDGTTTPQWYVVGTVHQGGTRFYATAQNSTSIFYQDDSTGPVELTDLTGLEWPTGTGDTASETWWSNSGWTR